MDAQGDTGRRLTIFGLAGQEYAIPTALVREVIRPARPRPVPGAPSYVDGVISLNGGIVPVVDLRACAGLPIVWPDGWAVVVVALGRLTVGIVVDDAREALWVEDDDCSPARGGAEGEFVEAVATLDDRVVLVLDMARLLHEGALAA